MSYGATHVVPDTGLRTWPAPDPAQPEGPRLEPGTDIQVVERRGAWAKVACSNGWEGWVDGSQLAGPAGPPPPPPPVAAAPSTRRIPPQALAVLGVVVVAIAAFALTRSDDDGAAGGGDRPVTQGTIVDRMLGAELLVEGFRVAEPTQSPDEDDHFRVHYSIYGSPVSGVPFNGGVTYEIYSTPTRARTAYRSSAQLLASSDDEEYTPTASGVEPAVCGIDGTPMYCFTAVGHMRVVVNASTTATGHELDRAEVERVLRVAVDHAKALVTASPAGR